VELAEYKNMLSLNAKKHKRSVDRQFLNQLSKGMCNDESHFLEVQHAGQRAFHVQWSKHATLLQVMNGQHLQANH
jgi:hypothetical protein